MIDKMIHAAEFRLRILLTNKCNKNCAFCLNDFQAKGRTYAFAPDVIDCIRAYGQFMKSIKQESIVTFSGGEPGIHPNLNIMLTNAAYYCNTVKLVTNGTALNEIYLPYVSKWHIGCTDKNLAVADFRKLTDKIVVQIVVTDDMRRTDLEDIVKFYKDNGIIVVKLFQDIFSKNKLKVRSDIQYIHDKFEGICTRFTGHQINRGEACAGCEKDCVTLKALWYFPNGTASTCPQGMLPPYDDDSWDETVEKAYNAHIYEGIMGPE